MRKLVATLIALALVSPVFAQQGWDVQKDRQMFKAETVVRPGLNDDAELKLQPDDNRTPNRGWRIQVSKDDGDLIFYNELNGNSFQVSTAGVVTVSGNMDPTCDDINVDGNELDILFDAIESSLTRGTLNLVVSENDSVGEASNDVAAVIHLFKHYNDAGGSTTGLVSFGQILITATDVTGANEDSTIAFKTVAAGSETTALTLTGDDATVAGDATVTGLTASKPVFTDSNKKLVSTGTLAVDQGGSGAATLTDHGVLVGSGTGAVTPLSVGGANEALMGAAGADPVFRALTDADIPNDATVSNYYTKAEADAAFATAAQGVSGTNAETKVTTGADPGHTHTAYQAADADLTALASNNGAALTNLTAAATAAQGVAATNAQTLAQARIASVAMSMAHNDATNGVVYMQLKNAAGTNPAAMYMAHIWCSKTALGAPDSSDLDVASSISCGTEIKDLGGDDLYYVATDGDGKISWAFITTVTPNTNYFYCSVDGVVLGSQTVVIPME